MILSVILGQGEIKNASKYIANRVFSTGTPTVNRDNRLDVVQHAHPDSRNFHWHMENLTSDSTEVYLWIDISDLTEFKHKNLDYIHLEQIIIDVDSDVNATYNLEWGFLETVGSESGRFISVGHVSGSKQTGNQTNDFFNYYPNGPRCSESLFVTHEIVAEDTRFQTDVPLKVAFSRLPDRAPGARDLIFIIDVLTQSINIVVHGSYHSH